MARGDARLRVLAAFGCMLAAGCTQTSRVDDNLSTASLSQTRKAVAVMRVGAASPSCINVAVLLGVREGEGYRRHQGITVANVRSLTEPAVAEVELDPGEYHVLAYRCQSAKGVTTLDDSDGGQLYRSSYASFTLQSGEIVNVVANIRLDAVPPISDLVDGDKTVTKGGGLEFLIWDVMSASLPIANVNSGSISDATCDGAMSVCVELLASRIAIGANIRPRFAEQLNRLSVRIPEERCARHDWQKHPSEDTRRGRGHRDHRRRSGRTAR